MLSYIYIIIVLYFKNFELLFIYNSLLLLNFLIRSLLVSTIYNTIYKVGLKTYITHLLSLYLQVEMNYLENFEAF